MSRLGEQVERRLKRALRYSVAINQSRAKWVLDPVYEAAAALLIGSSVALDPRLVAKRYDDNLYFRYQRNARRKQWSVDDWDFAQARPDLLTERQRALVHTFATGETSGFAVGSSFLQTFRTSPELGPFFSVWFFEEMNHYWSYHRYLERMGQGWTEARKEEVTGVGFRPYSSCPLEVSAANMHQELIGYLVYRSFARQCRDPFLARLVTVISKDELRHYKFYQCVVARAIQRDPSFRKIVLKHFFKATTPLNQVSGSPARVIENLTGPAFYFRRPEYDFMLRELKFLLGDSLESVFAFFYRRNLPPCDHCGHEPFQCSCETFE